MATRGSFRAGIVGFGMMGKVHAKAYANSNCAEVVAICNRSDLKMAEYLNKNPRCHPYNNWKAMLKAEDLDVLSVATYSPSHREIVVHGAESGISEFFVRNRWLLGLMTLKQ